MNMFGIPFRRSSKQEHANKTTRKQPRPTGRMRHLYLEALEDRRLLSGNYANIGAGLSNIATALQTQLNNHLWDPLNGPGMTNLFSLPIVGTQLSAGAGQFLQTLATQLKSVTAADYNSLVGYFQNTLHNLTFVSVSPNQAAGGLQQNEDDLELEIMNQPVQIASLDFQLGLPGLEQSTTQRVKDVITQVENNLKIDGKSITLKYSMFVFFKVDSQGTVTLDTTQNTTASPLVSVTFAATYNIPQNSLTVPLVPNVGLGVTGSGNLNFVAALSDAAPNRYDVTKQQPKLTTNVNLANGGQPPAVFDFMLTIGATNFPSLFTDLKVNWNLAAAANPLDSSALTNTLLEPTISFDVGIGSLSSLAGWLNPVLEGIQKQLAPLKPIIDTLTSVLTTKIPILGDLLPQFDNLEDILKNNPVKKVDITPLVDFLMALDGILNWKDQPFSLSSDSIMLASYTLPDDDPRTSTYDLGTLLDKATSQFKDDVQSPGKQLAMDIQAIIPFGTLSLPLLTDPLDDLKTLLLGDNVVLVQYQFPQINNLGADFTLPPIPIVPPMTLELDLGFHISGDLTIGYDTYGFSSDWAQNARTYDITANLTDPVSEGIFITSPTDLQLTGQIGLKLAANFGIVQVGGGGTLGLSFGITGLHEGNAFPMKPPPNVKPSGSDVHPYHTAIFPTPNKPNNTEDVLQLGDLKYDLQNGGPLCPFNIGGGLTLGLEAFVTVGIGPFSVTVDVDFGTITIASFTIDTCSGNMGTVQLAELFNSTNDPNFTNLNSDLSTLPTNEPHKASDVDKLLGMADPDYAGTQRFVLLDLGQFDKNLQAEKLNPTQNDGKNRESFEISPVLDSMGNPTNDLLVSAFGLEQPISGANSKGKRTTILAFGGTASGKNLPDYNLPEDITVDPGVHANVVCFGGSNQNNFQYGGDGDCYMAGGTWNAATSLPETGGTKGPPYDPNTNPNGSQTLNTLGGGSGHNYLLGGGLSSAFPNAQELTASWNVVTGGVHGANTLQGGTAGATLRAGDDSPDVMRGSLDPNAAKSSYGMVAGQGNDLMYGGYGFNTYQWGERKYHQSHSLTVQGSAVQGVVHNDNNVYDEVDVAGNQGFESWTLDPETPGRGVRISSTVGQIDAYAVQAVGVDAEDTNNTGGETYLINDLSRTGIQKVNVNLHQWTTQPDKNADHVTAEGAPGDDTVTLGVGSKFDHIDSGTGEPVYLYEYTDVTMATVIPPPPSELLPKAVQYDIFTALPKKGDTLKIDTFEGNDTVTVKATQPDQTSINTGDGDDIIKVGVGILDDIEGALVIDAGRGHNQIVFNDFASPTADVATLTTDLKPVSDPKLGKLQDSLLGDISKSLSGPKGYLLRYKGEFLKDPNDPRGAHYRYPLGITFLASGGDFAPVNGNPGVVFNATYDASKPSMIYVDSLLPMAPTSVNTGGADQVYVGFDGGRTRVPSDPGSTLDYISSTLTVNDNGPYQATLLIDDEGTSRPDTYEVTAKAPQPNGNGSVSRVNSPVIIDYDALAALVLRTPTDQNNTIIVAGTVLKTATTIFCGNGDNTVTVGDTAKDWLDNVLGPLQINGSNKGMDDLTINDKGNGKSQNYALSDTNLSRKGVEPVSITFHDLHSLTFNASTGNNNSITVTGTPVNVPVAVYPGPGMGDQLHIVDLDNIQGPLKLIWTQGVKTIVADDTATKAAQTYTLLPNELQRSGAKPISFGEPLGMLTLDVGLTHDDTVKVQAINSGTSVQINAGKVNTTVLVADSTQNLDSIAGPLAINGAGSPASTTVLLEDQNEPTSRNTYTLNQAAFQAANLPIISFSQLTGLLLDAGNQGNEIYVKGTAAGNEVRVNAGTKNDRIVVSDSSNSLKEIKGKLGVVGNGPNDRLEITDTGGSSMATYVLTGGVLQHPLSAAIGYKNIKSVRLAGSTGGCSYQVVSTPASTSVQIVASGTFNTLDYVSYSGSVVVDLRTGFATGLSGGISGIQNVIGGNGGPAGTYNLLIGIGGNNLVGGTGRRNILVAGTGASHLFGGNEDDLLIAGTTDYDTEAGLASWLKIVAYWAGTDPFATRVSKLESGSGVPKLDASSVHGNGGGNDLVGMSELALIFSDDVNFVGPDTIVSFNFKSSQQVTIKP
jgi:hypothetical protein